MAIFDDIKKASIELRKTRSELAPFSVFLIAEIQKIGKNAGRDVTDADTIQVLKKTLATTEENIRNLNEWLSPPPSEYENVAAAGELAFQRLVDEAEFLRDFIPPMASDEDVRSFLNSTFTDTPNKGQVMKALKEKFGAYVDMKAAGTIYTEMYGS